MGRRNAPTLLNRARGTSFFWDGRAASLEEAMLRLITDEKELALSVVELVQRIGAVPRYREELVRAYPGQPVSAVTIGRALASYIRTLRSGNSPLDGTLSALGKRGRVFWAERTAPYR